MKYNDNGEFKDIYVKSFDTLPVGTEVDFDGDSVPSGWTAVDNVLYNDTTGTNSTITLNDNVSNYNYIEVFYRDSDNQYNSVKVFSPNNKKAFLTTSTLYNNKIYYKTKVISISGTSITNTSTAQMTCEASGNTITTDNFIYITRVVGYKE